MWSRQFPDCWFYTETQSERIFAWTFKNRVYISYSPLVLPVTSPTGFQSHILWRLVLLVQISLAGKPDVKFGTPAPPEEPWRLWYLSFLWVSVPQVWVLARPHFHSFYPSQWSFSFLSFVAENLFFASLHVVLIYIFYICGCIFVVFMKGWEPRIFLSVILYCPPIFCIGIFDIESTIVIYISSVMVIYWNECELFLLYIADSTLNILGLTL